MGIEMIHNLTNIMFRIVLLSIFLAILVLLYVFYDSMRLYFYLGKKKPMRFKRLSIYYPGYPETFRVIEYIFNNDDVNNKTILSYKRRLRLALRVSVIFVALFFGTGILIEVLRYYFG